MTLYEFLKFIHFSMRVGGGISTIFTDVVDPILPLASKLRELLRFFRVVSGAKIVHDHEK